MVVSLYPFSARIRLSCADDWQGCAWDQLLTDLFAEIAGSMHRAGAVAIGHIKGIASDGQRFLTINCVSDRLTPDTEGDLSDAREIDLNLTVLVYGLEWDIVRRTFLQVSQQLCEFRGCSMHVQLIAPSHSSSTHH